MSRNFLKGAEVDRINAILAVAGYNMRKLINAFLYVLIKLGSFLQNSLFERRKYLWNSIWHYQIKAQDRLFHERLFEQFEVPKRYFREKLVAIFGLKTRISKKFSLTVTHIDTLLEKMIVFYCRSALKLKVRLLRKEQIKPDFCLMGWIPALLYGRNWEKLWGMFNQ